VAAPATPATVVPSTPPTASTGPAASNGEAQVLAAVNEGNSVFFQSGRSEIDAAGERLLQQHAERLKANPRLRVTLVGHTNDLGSPAYNLAIAEQRVDAVHRRLREAGVPARQLRRYVVGAEKTSKACHSVECRRKMRRVELVYRK
jgi:peptidoglycan-associated lipoprotein